MWTLNYDTHELIYKIKNRQREPTCSCRGQGGLAWEFGAN